MTNVNFGSTYRIKVTQAGINSAKKARLSELVKSYPNGMVGKGKDGYARLSIPESEDNAFVTKLKNIGYKIFQIFEEHNIDKRELDYYIKEQLDTRNYRQVGKNMKKMSTEMKLQRRYERNLIKPEKEPEVNEILPEVKKQEPVKYPKAPRLPQQVSEKNKIRNTADYIRIKNQYGEEAAELIFFGRQHLKTK